MKTIDSGLFNGWNAIWRYPTLLIEVASQLKDHELIPATEISRRMLSDIALAQSPGEAFDRLIKDGEFKAATLLLSFLKRDNAVLAADLKDMAIRIEEQKARAFARIEVRKFELTTRAMSVNLDSSPPGGLMVVDESLSAAQAILDTWEAEISWKEDEQKKLLLLLFEDARERFPQSDPNREIWEKAVTSSIEMCRVRTASKLIEIGPLAIVGRALEPNEVPRRPVWSYTLSVADVLRLLSPKTGNNEIKEEWGPHSEDKAALKLLESLGPLVQAEGKARPDEIQFFVSSLDSLLGVPAREHRVTVSVTGLTSVLYGLSEKAVPRLAISGESVPIWFPLDHTSDVPDHLRDCPVIIAFHPHRDATENSKILTFTSTLLFRLLGDRHRRLNFIRWLGRQIKTEDMMPATLDLSLLPTDDDGIRRYAAWLLDLHGIPITSDSVLELIVFYSASSSFVLRALLAELGAGIQQEREEGLEPQHVHKAWASERFRDAAIAHFLQPLAGDPWLLSVLACVYFTAGPDEEITPDFILEWLSLFGYAGNRDVTSALEQLVHCSLLAKGNKEGSVWVPRSARTLLVREHVVDLEEYVTNQLKLLRD
jgi:hypothetical protein